MRSLPAAFLLSSLLSLSACGNSSDSSSSTTVSTGAGGATSGMAGASGSASAGKAGTAGSGVTGGGAGASGSAGAIAGGASGVGGGAGSGATSGAAGKGGASGNAGAAGSAGSKAGASGMGMGGVGGTSGGAGMAGVAGASGLGGTAGVAGAAGAGVGGASGAAGAGGAGGASVVQLATNEFGINALALDGANVYWVSSAIAGGAVKKLPKLGGAVVPLATAQGELVGVATDGTSVFYTAHAVAVPMGQVLSVPVIGGPPTPIALGQYKPQKIAYAANKVVWATSGAGNAGKSQVWMWTVGGAAPIPLFTGSSTDSPYGIDLGPTDVYFSDQSLAHAALSVPIAGGNSTLVTTLPGMPPKIPTPGEVVVLGNTLYLMDVGGGGIPGGLWAAPLPTGTATQVGVAMSTGGGVAGDLAGVYWADPNGGNVWTLKPGDTSSTVFWTLPGDFPVELAVDASHVYCATVGGALYSIPR